MYGLENMFCYEVERKLSYYKELLNNKQDFRKRFILDPLSKVILDEVSRYHKLECLLLAVTLLRYSDLLKLNKEDFINGIPQKIIQSKTKEQIIIPSLFINTTPTTIRKLPDITPFTDSYTKINYSLRKAIPTWIKSQFKTERSVTHIFRFLRTCYLSCKFNDNFIASKWLGHKDDRTIKSYKPPDLINLYYKYLQEV